MRNSFGGLNIYQKALWWSLLYIFLPGGAILITWYALFENPGAWIHAIYLWLLCGFGVWALRHRFWDTWRDAFARRTTTLKGNVGRKWVTERTEQGATLKDYEIAVNHRSFEVSKKIYNWLSEGDEVVVHYWPRTETVSKVEKIG